MAITEDTAAASAGRRRVAAHPERGRRGAAGHAVHVGNVFRLLVLVALAAFLLYYVGPREHRRDAAQGRPRRRPVRGALDRRQPALRPGLRPLDPLQHDPRRRPRVRRLLRGRGQRLVPHAVRRAGPSPVRAVRQHHRLADRPLDINGLLWGLIGGAALGLVMFLLSAPRQQLARLPLAVVGFTGFGLLTAFAIDESARPSIDWAQAVDLRRRRRRRCSALIGLWRRGPSTAAAVGSSPAPASAGSSAPGAAATSARGNFLGVALRHRRPGGDPRPPLRADHASPTPPAAGASSRRSRAWIFVPRRWRSSPSGSLVPLIRTIYLSFHNRNGTRVRRLGQLPRDLQQQELGQPRQLGQLLHQPAVLDRPRAGRHRHPRRHPRRPADEPDVRARPGSYRPDLRRLLPPRLRRPVDDAGHDLQQHLVGHRRHVAGDRHRPRRRRARRPVQGRERAPSR